MNLQRSENKYFYCNTNLYIIKNIHITHRTAINVNVYVGVILMPEVRVHVMHKDIRAYRTVSGNGQPHWSSG